MLNELLAAGYTRSFESGDGRQAGDAPAQTSTAVRRPPSAVYDWRGIEWSSYNRTVCLPSGVRLDLGGIAKGWAADEAVRRLGSYAAAMVDAGGDITVSGPMSGGGRWPIGMANPLAPDEALEVLMLEGGAVATSGKDYRKWQVNGEWKHHILDPRTGQPAETDVLSATVIAPTACEAEVAAKIAFIKGSRDGMAWLEDQPQLAGLLVLEDGTVLRSSRVEEYVKRKGKGKKAKRKT
jgi:thiamine biosynthesis lipoprotein